jgi:hypothetical protein
MILYSLGELKLHGYNHCILIMIQPTLIFYLLIIIMSRRKDFGVIIAVEKDGFKVTIF